MNKIEKGKNLENGNKQCPKEKVSVEERNLQVMRQFYRAFPIPHTLCAELSWIIRKLIEQQQILENGGKIQWQS